MNTLPMAPPLEVIFKCLNLCLPRCHKERQNQFMPIASILHSSKNKLPNNPLMNHYKIIKS